MNDQLTDRIHVEPVSMIMMSRGARNIQTYSAAYYSTYIRSPRAILPRRGPVMLPVPDTSQSAANSPLLNICHKTDLCKFGKDRSSEDAPPGDTISGGSARYSEELLLCRLPRGEWSDVTVSKA